MQNLDVKVIAKIIHQQLMDRDPAVIKELRQLILSDIVDITKDEFLDNFSFSTLQNESTKEFLEKSKTAEFYKERAKEFAKNFMEDQLQLLNESIEKANIEASSSVQSTLRVSLSVTS